MKKRIILVFLLSIIFLSGCSLINEETDNKKETKVVDNYDDVLRMSINSSYILLQDNFNDLYLYGNYSNVNLSTNTPKKLYSNISYFKNSGRLIIIDNKGNAYYMGLDKDGIGSKNTFELLMSDVKKFASNNYCFYVIDKDGDLRFKIPTANKDAISYCALTGNYIGDLSKEISGVKDIYTSLTIFGYVLNNGDLYASYSFNPNFEKILSEVNYVRGEHILTKDNKLYTINASVIDRKPEAKLISENINYVFDNNFYKLNNGDYYFTNKKLEFNDIRYPYYYSGEVFIYLNKNNKLVLTDKTDKKEIDLSVDTMKDIYDFINKTDKENTNN